MKEDGRRSHWPLGPKWRRCELRDIYKRCGMHKNNRGTPQSKVLHHTSHICKARHIYFQQIFFTRA